MSKELVISATPHETRVAILEDGHLCEIYIEREKEFALVGSIYKGRVTRVLPGMQSAFVDIGRDTDAFLYVSDFLENLEEYDNAVPGEGVKPVGQVAAPAAIASAPASVPAGTIPFVAAPSAPVRTHQPAPVRHHLEVLPGEHIAKAESGGGISDVADAEIGESSQPEPGNYAPVASESHAPLTDIEPGDPPQPKDNSTPALNPLAHLQRHSGAPRRDRGFSGGGMGRGRDRGGERSDRGDRGGRSGADRGGDRGPRRSGGGGGGGRFRGRGGRDRQGGARDLPSSKYASPQGGDRGPRREHSGGFRGPAPVRRSEPSGPAPTGENFEPIILPGESLAKYKERAAAGPSGAAGASQITPAAASALAGEASVVRENAETFPETLYAEPLPLRPHDYAAEDVAEVNLPTEAPTYSGGTSTSEPIEIPHDLSDEQAATLAESLAEAKHEETTDEASSEDAHQIGGVELEAAGAQSETEELIEEISESISAADDGEEIDDSDEADAAHEAAEHADAMGTSETMEAADSESGDDTESENESEGNEHESAGEQSESGSEDANEAVGNVLAAADQTEDSGTGNRQAPPQNFQPRSARVEDRSRRPRFQRPARRNDRQGGRPMRHGHSRPHGGHSAPRRPQLIAEMLKAGQEIIVQIAKEPLGKKGARITSHVALPGRFLVYMPTVDHVGVSRKINTAEERSRLRRLVSEYKGSFPGGFIVRTAAGHVSDADIRADVEFLGKTWHEICARSEQRKAPALLHRDLNLVERILRDYMNSDYSSIWIDNEEEFSKVLEFVSRFQPELANRVKLYTKDAPIFEEFGIQQELDKALRPKVWLKSGGYIVINHTEALVAIDVNTGKFVGRGSTRLEDTIVKTNLEAVKEIVRQIRLRDLGGIIVVDFIDMEERRNREKVMHALDDSLRADKAPSKVLAFNEFGLITITRKRTKQSLEKVLCQPCPYCTGSGMVKSIPTICYEIQVEARKMAGDLDSQSLTLRVNPEIAKALKTRESGLIEELENLTKKSAIIQADPTLHWEQYDIF